MERNNRGNDNRERKGRWSDNLERDKYREGKHGVVT